MSQKFLSNIELNAGLVDGNDTTGTSGQVLTSTGTGVEWIDQAAITGSGSNKTYYEVKNSSGATILKGKGVMAVGTDGNSGHILIDEMVADGTVEPRYFMGVLEDSLDNGEIGTVIAFGELDQFNTNGQNGETWVDGQILWCDPDSAGDFTTTQPTAPAVKIPAAFILKASTQGKIQIRVQANEGLHELHDTHITTQSDGEILVWDNTNEYWFNDSTLTVDYTNGRVGMSSYGGGAYLYTLGSFRIDIDSNNDATDRAFIVSKDNAATQLFKVEESGAVTLSGALKGPSTFYIDPSPDDTYGDATTDTGTVVILGDLQVTGQTTTVNSTVVDIADLNLTLASNATTASQADGAGITIGGASATLTYASATDDFHFNKTVNAGTFVGALTGNVTGNLTGNADTATSAGKWTTARTITLGGDLTGNVSIDGSANVTLTAAVVDDSHNHDGRYYTETEADSRFLLNTTDTLTGDLTVTGEANIKNTIYSEFGSSNTDITGLLSGSTFGTWIKGRSAGHVVIGIRDNDANDSFAIMSGSGNYTTDSTYDKLLARFQANGAITLGGDTSINGDLTVTGNGAATFSNSVTANSFIKSGGTSSQFLKADGSVDSNSYLTSYTESDTLQSVTNRGSSTTNTIVSTSAVTLSLENTGTGTYNKTVIYNDAGGFLLEGAKATDSNDAAKLPVTLTWRGNYNGNGGLKLNGDTKLYTTDTGLGIDETNPSYPLDVNGNIRAYSAIRLNSSATGDPYLALYQNMNEVAYLQYVDAGDILVTQSDGAYVLKTGGNSNRISVGSDGMVEINSEHIAAKKFRVYYDMDVYNTVWFTDQNYVAQAAIAGNGGELYLYSNGSANRPMTLTSGGSVLVGRTSNATSQALQVEGFIDQTDTSAAFRLYNGSTFIGGIGNGNWAYGASWNGYYSIYANSDKLLFSAGGGNSPKMALDISSNLTINGTTSHSKLTILSGTNTTDQGDGITFMGTSINNQAAIWSHNEGAYRGDLRFYTSNYSTASTARGTLRFKITGTGENIFYAPSDGSILNVRTTYSGNARIFDVGQVGSDGYLKVNNAIGTTYTSLSGYSGTPSWFNTKVAIGQTSATYQLDVQGDIRATENILSKGFEHTVIGTATTPVSTAGWYKIVQINSRGGGVLNLSFTGGNFTPVTYKLKYYKDWSNNYGLILEKYGVGGWITNARIKQDAVDSLYYLEIYGISNVNGLSFSVYHDKLLGYNATSTVYTGALTATGAGGTVISDEMSFESSGITAKHSRFYSDTSANGISLHGRLLDDIGELNFLSNNGTWQGRVDGRNNGLGLYSTSGQPIRIKAGGSEQATFNADGSFYVSDGTYSASKYRLVLGNDNTAILPHISYDTMLIQQTDAPTLRLYERGEALSTTLASDNGVSRLASSGKLAFHTGGTYNAVGYNGMGGTEAITIATNSNVGFYNSSPNAPVHFGNATRQQQWLVNQSVGGWYSGIKLARGGGDWTSTANNNFGFVTTDSGLEISRYDDATGSSAARTTFLTLNSTGSLIFSSATSISVAAISHYSNGYLYMKGGSSGAAVVDSTGAYGLYATPSQVQITTNNAPAVTIDSSQHSVFKGNIVIDSDWGVGNYGAEQLTVEGTYPSLCLRNTTGDFKWLFHGDSDDALKIYTGTGWNTSTGWTWKLRLSSNGFFGIGEAIVPAYKLDVNGEAATAARFYTTNDVTLQLESSNSWTGIRMKDGNGQDDLWFYGGSQTWAFGGGGSTTSGKKMHINGGVSIGSGAAAVAMPTNGLYVEGGIYVGTPSTTGGQNTNQSIYIPNAGEYFTMGYKLSSRDGKIMHRTNGTTDSTGFYIEAGSTEAGGICLDQDSVNVYGSSDAGTTFRVIDKDAGVVTFEMLQTSWNGVFRGDVIAYGSMSSISDIRIKENIEPYENVLDRLCTLGVYSYNKITAPKHKRDKKEIGVIAQEMQVAFPELVETEKVDKPEDANGLEEILTVDYEHLTAILLQSVKELREEVNQLKERLDGSTN